jgi:hypothetical protein
MTTPSIRVNCYDIFASNSAMRNTKFCFYHTSVVIGDQLEVDYGKYTTQGSGLRVTRRIDQLHEIMPVTFYETYPIVRSRRSLSYCERVIDRFRKDPRWLSERYNIIYNNCHTFSYLLTEALVGEGNLHCFPSFVFLPDRIAEKIYAGLVRHVIPDSARPALLGKPLKNQSNLLARESTPPRDSEVAFY